VWCSTRTQTRRCSTPTRPPTATSTITAGPAQKAADIKDDPALRTTADTMQQTSGDIDNKIAEGKSKPDAKNKAAGKVDNEVVRIDQVPADAQCRKVTTAMETKSTGKKAAPKEDNKTTNVSILCQMGGEWKPAST
jgi:hypothetical protein